MYATGTILELKEQREPERKIDPQTGEPAFVKKRNRETGELENTKTPAMQVFPYNKVKVVGKSPVVHEYSEWTGTDAEGVIIEPITEFAGNLDEPIGKIRLLYNVVHTPEEKVYQPEIRVIEANTQQAGPTPEEIFAQEAPGEPPKAGQTRARTPFEDVKPPAGSHGKSPL
jgi:hypothetical protein